MRFSIRSVLLLILVFACACAYYNYKRPYRIPIVAKTPPVEHEVPGVAVYYLDQTRVREAIAEWESLGPSEKPQRNETRFEVRCRELEKDLVGFKGDMGVVRANPDEFRKRALAELDDATPFARIDAACRILFCLGGNKKPAINYVTDRYAKHLPDDPKAFKDWPFWDAVLTDDDIRYFTTRKAFFDELMRMIKSGTISDEGVNYLTEFLARAGRNDLAVKVFEKKGYATPMLDWANHRKYALPDEQFKFALAELEKDHEYKGYLALSLFQNAKISRPEHATAIKQTILEVLESNPDADRFYSMVKISDESDADYFRTVLSNPDTSQRTRAIAITKLLEFGCAEAVELLSDLIDSVEFENVYEFGHAFSTYRKTQGKNAIPLLEKWIGNLIYELTSGKASLAPSELATQPSCGFGEKSSTHCQIALCQAIEDLGELGRDTKDGRMIGFLRQAFAQFGRLKGVSRRPLLVIVQALKVVGDDQAEELLNKIPKPVSTAERASAYSRPDLLNVEEFIDYVNTELSPRPLLTVEDVVFDHRGQLHHYQLVELLAQRGVLKTFGDHEYPVNWMPGMAYDMCKLAADDFPVKAVLQDGLELKLVVENRLFTIQLSGPQSQQMYDCYALVDILNTIVANRGETKRFYVFFPHHVIYTDPRIAEDLEEKFGFWPVRMRD